MAKSINKLKDQARSHEQKEEWEKAAQLYQQVLHAAEEEGSLAAEMGLYNRIGDIYLRLGRAREAVAFYEQAADHYAADGLFNNAIALCNKALRQVPDRLELYRKLGRLSASQGFLTDARRWFVEFAERSLKHGALDDAFDALKELADFTDDPEIRELLARQLKAHDRPEAAVDELRRAYAARLRAGNRAGAEAVREELRTIDAAAPDSLEGALQEAPAAAGALEGLPLLEEPEPLEAAAPTEAPAPADALAPAEAPAAAVEPAPAQAPAPAAPSVEAPTAPLAEAPAPPPVEPPPAAAPAAAESAQAPPVAEAPPLAGLEAPPAATDVSAERPEGFAPTHFADDWGESSVVIAPELEPAAPAPEGVEPFQLSEAETLEPIAEIEEPEEPPAPLPLLEAEEIAALELEEETEVTPLPFLEVGEEELEAEEEGALPPPLPFLEGPESFEEPVGGAQAEAEPLAPQEEEQPEPWSAPAEEEPWAAPPAEEPWAQPAAPEPWQTILTEEPWAETPPEPQAPKPPEARPGAVPGPAAAAPQVEPEAEPPDEVLTLARSLYAHGQPVAGRAAIEQLLADAERGGNQSRKLQLLEALAGLEPDDVAVQQRRVEQAFAVRGPRGAVQALLGLATALERTGGPERASVVYLQVLDIDPANATAGAALKKEKEARPKKQDDGGFVDLGALLLEDEEPHEDTTRFTVSEATPTGDEEADFVEMLEQFKEKVAEHMGEDPQAHYDLGLAYKEMGLLDEAVAEFQIALRNGQDRLRVLEELGRCFLLKEEPRIALRLLGQALAVEGRTEMEYMGVNYLLGRCYEDIGEYDAARDAYERIIGLDIQFNDVAERLARL